MVLPLIDFNCQNLCKFIYSDGSLNEPPSLNEPAAILNVDLNTGLLHFIYYFYCIVSTVEKNRVAIIISLPEI